MKYCIYKAAGHILSFREDFVGFANKIPWMPTHKMKFKLWLSCLLMGIATSLDYKTHWVSPQGLAACNAESESTVQLSMATTREYQTQACLCSETKQDGFSHHLMADDKFSGLEYGWRLTTVCISYLSEDTVLSLLAVWCDNLCCWSGFFSAPDCIEAVKTASTVCLLLYSDVSGIVIFLCRVCFSTQIVLQCFEG